MNTLNIHFPSALFGKQKLFKLTPDELPKSKPMKVLVLHDSIGEIDSQDAELLQKILAAAKISATDFLVENIHRHFSLSQLLQEFNPNFLIVFSNQKTALGKNIDLPLNEIITLYNTKILRTVKLKELPTQPELKKKFWGKMKIMFNF